MQFPKRKAKSVEDDGEHKESTEKRERKPKTRLWTFASPLDMFMIVVATICSIACGAAQPGQILLLGTVVGKIGATLISGDYSSVASTTHYVVLLFVYLGVAATVSGYLAHFCWVMSGERQAMRLRKAYVASVLRQDMEWFDTVDTESHTSRLSDANVFQTGVSEKLGDGIQIVAQFLTGILVAFIEGWKLALVIIAVVPIVTIIGVLLAKKLKGLGKSEQDIRSKSSATAEQVLANIRTVHSFSLQQTFQTLYNGKIDEAREVGFRKARWTGLTGLIMFVMFCCLGLGFWYGSKLVYEGELQGQKVMIVFFALLTSAMELSRIPDSLTAFTAALAALDRLLPTIERVPKIDTSSNDGTRPAMDRSIRLSHVSFAYPSRPTEQILHDFDLEIKPGSTVAFVGESGCGKSTIVSLIQRLYESGSGSISIDGQNIKDININHLRSNIGVVSQEPVLFDTTIRENLCLGFAYKDETVMDACHAANCSELVDTIGLDTPVRGTSLSGGQKQRLCIARAILKDPKILLLDEATSALDVTSERVVQDALNEVAKKRTTIIVAHRLSTIAIADVIVVLEKGKIVEKGTHEELLRLHGAYYSFVNGQKLDSVDEAEQSEKREISPSITRMSDKEGNAMLAIDMPIEERVIVGKLWKNCLSLLEKNDRRNLCIGLFGALMAGVAFPSFALVFSRIIVILVENTTQIQPPAFQGSNLYAFLFVVIGIGLGLALGLQNIFLGLAKTAFISNAQSKLFGAFLAQEVGFHDTENVGTQSVRLSSDCVSAALCITDTWSGIATITSTFTTGLIIAFINSWELTLIVLLTVPIVAVAQIHRVNKNKEDIYEQTYKLVQEAFTNMRTVQSLGRQPWINSQYRALLNEPHRKLLKLTLISSARFALLSSFRMWVSAIGYYAGTTILSQGKISFTNMFTVLIALMLTSQRAGEAFGIVSQYGKAKLAAFRIFSVINRTPRINVDAVGWTGAINGNISFKNAAFQYPTRPEPVFTNFNLNGESGKTLAVVGPSGCGKSTIIGLLQRWYDVTNGTVAVDERDVKSYQLDSLRSNIALVSQEPVLFDLSIRENILLGALGDPQKINMDDIMEQTNLSFVSKFDAGLDTRVGDKGGQLSGGQKQRIAIARALVRNPALLLLDEATSALDSESEALVHRALEKFQCTRVIVAHRLKTIQHADQIAVLNHGTIVEQGSHSELLHLNKIYASMTQQQAI